MDKEILESIIACLPVIVFFIAYTIVCLHMGGITFKISLFFRWFDLWVGLYIDVEHETLYFIPFPMFGLKIRIIRR